MARPGYASRCVNLGNAVGSSSVYWIALNKIHHNDQQQSETQNYSLHLEFNMSGFSQTCWLVAFLKAIDSLTLDLALLLTPPCLFESLF